MKINIVYWSGTGNTRAMAELIEQGAKDAGAEVSVIAVSNADLSALDADVLALGCPSMGSEVLEEDEFEPFISFIENKVTGKKLALFGSYGWGDGQWMRDWIKRMLDAGAIIENEGLIVNEAPEGEDAQRCIVLGAKIASA